MKRAKEETVLLNYMWFIYCDWFCTINGEVELFDSRAFILDT